MRVERNFLLAFSRGSCELIDRVGTGGLTDGQAGFSTARLVLDEEMVPTSQTNFLKGCTLRLTVPCVFFTLF
jgi:hypothetical protein